jgi:hypothetical protein
MALAGHYSWNEVTQGLAYVKRILKITKSLLGVKPLLKYA